MKLHRQALAVLCGALASIAVSVGTAHACACCTNPGQRQVGVAKIDSGKRDDLERLRFAAAAQLYTGERDAADFEGITTPSIDYEMHVTQEASRWVFDFRDKAGHTGTLSFVLPATMAFFEVDPRTDEREGGTGPALYKEWTVTAKAAGTGIFAPGMRGGARISLILQGHGNSCGGSDDFNHWTLDVKGPKAGYSFIGSFVR
jgi:hypothetical protein